MTSRRRFSVLPALLAASCTLDHPGATALDAHADVPRETAHPLDAPLDAPLDHDDTADVRAMDASTTDAHTAIDARADDATARDTVITTDAIATLDARPLDAPPVPDASAVDVRVPADVNVVDVIAVPDVTRVDVVVPPIDVPVTVVCGGGGQTCCAGGACGIGSGCLDWGGGVALCGPCGVRGARCCAGNTCAQGRCRTLGAIGVCVDSNAGDETAGGDCNNSGHACDRDPDTRCVDVQGNDSCVSCGHPGQPCCFGVCVTGATCHPQANGLGACR